ncbi:MAG: phosphodiester glycosidase family protein [Verrucomicrobiota bacterium]
MRSTLQNPTALWRSAALTWVLAGMFTVSAQTLPGSKTSHSEVGRGLIYKNDRLRGGPWSVHLLKIDRTRTDLQLVTTLAGEKVMGVATLTQQIRTVPPSVGRPLAAMNGDFFRERDMFEGDPRGLQIMNGELVSGPNGKACFWIDTNGHPNCAEVMPQFKVTLPSGESVPFGLNEPMEENIPVLFTPIYGPSTYTDEGPEVVLERAGQRPWLPLRIGQNYVAVVRSVRNSGNTRLTSDTMVLSLGRYAAKRLPAIKPGTILKISTATLPNLAGASTAIGGGPMLVVDGAVPSIREYKAHDRHPRAAIGWNDQYIFFAEVDGRQRGLSIGMTLPELGAYLVSQGCLQAMNLDGGGSAELWLEGRIVNSPCYGHERETGNAIVVVQKKKDPPAAAE